MSLVRGMPLDSRAAEIRPMSSRVLLCNPRGCTFLPQFWTAPDPNTKQRGAALRWKRASWSVGLPRLPPYTASFSLLFCIAQLHGDDALRLLGHEAFFTILMI